MGVLGCVLGEFYIVFEWKWGGFA
jgi:hypothetical protein